MTQASVEFDHYPEVVENNAGIRRLELLGIKETLRDPSDRRQFFAHMDDDGYTQMLGYVNSITRNETIDYEYQDGHSPSTYTPPMEDKKPLMDLTFQTMREILTDPELDDRTALRRAGLTIAGSSAYTHPKEEGNGRMGRASHYLVEFGTERGDQAFEEEMYAIIGKTRVYDTDPHIAMYSVPPSELDRLLDAQIATYQKDIPITPRKHATARVLAFLDVMRGKGVEHQVSQAGIEMYEEEYLRLSSIPNREPGAIPQDAQRVMARKPKRQPTYHSFDLEYVD